MMVAESQLQRIIHDRVSTFSISYRPVMQERLDRKYADEKSLRKKFEFSPPSGVKLLFIHSHLTKYCIRLI